MSNSSEQGKAQAELSSQSSMPRKSPTGRTLIVSLVVTLLCLAICTCIATGIAGLAWLMWPTQSNLYNGDPAWSPDGKQIAFVSNRSGDNRIYTMNTDGSHIIQLTKNPLDSLIGAYLFQQDASPRWSPDGKRLGFVWRVISGGNDLNDIYLMNA